MSLSMG